MKRVLICLLLLSVLMSCSSNYVIRGGVEGYIYCSETKLPLDSVEIGFLIDPTKYTEIK